MMARDKLSPEAASAMLAELPGWSMADDGNAIRRRFEFKNFSEAFGFMSRVALAAEKMDHHPEWLNIYNRVEVVLATHTVEGVTSLDVKLAHAMDQIAPSRDRG